MKYLVEYEDQDLRDLIGDLKKVGQVEEWQAVFDSGEDEVPYTLETWTSKKEAEKWAEDREFEYEDEVWDNIKQDYVWKTFHMYHNPEDGQPYHDCNIRKI